MGAEFRSDSSHQNIRIYADISIRTRFNSSIWFIYFIHSISNFVWKSEIVTAFPCVHLHVRVCGVCSCERKWEWARNEYTDLIPIEGGMLKVSAGISIECGYGESIRIIGSMRNNKYSEIPGNIRCYQGLSSTYCVWLYAVRLTTMHAYRIISGVSLYNPKKHISPRQNNMWSA